MVFNKKSDIELVDGIRKGNSKTLDILYQEFFPKVESFVVANNGCGTDARDVFQEALYSLYIKVKDNAFKLEKSFAAYFFTICKYCWYNELRIRSKNKHEVLDFDSEILIKQEPITDEFRELKIQEIYIGCFGMLDKLCREIIEMSMGSFSFKEIVEELKISSEGYARKKKFKCIQKLIKFVEQDKRFKELKNE